MYENQNIPPNSPMGAGPVFESPAVQVDANRMAAYMARVFGWMCVGLLVTAITAFFSASSTALMTLVFTTQYGFAVVCIAQLVLALAFSFRLQKMSATAASVMFLLYSAMTGVTFSVLFWVFEAASLIFVFGLTSLIFASMAIYGATTKKDLTSIGRLAIFGLFGLIIANAISYFLLQSTAADLVITSVGILIFIVLIAYDTQKIKNFYIFAVGERDANEYSDPMNKMAIYGAFTLYLDFINLFLKLMRLLGKRKG